ncbi:MAG TPA: hypothetical protein VFP35_02830 [Candidatus Saccharimonadales bacterium]|nr:hypothetical protein [Candidatus Saccharimonadales bacterium]
MANAAVKKRPEPVFRPGRTRRLNKKQAKTKAKAEARANTPVPNSFRLTAQVAGIFKKNWKILLGIVVVYLILNIIFASGLSGLGNAVSTIKVDLKNANGGGQALAKGISGFGSLVGSAGASGSASAGILQSVLFVLESLVIIWSLRQLLAGKTIGVKEAYYHSMFPLIPFLLVLAVIIIQLLPITIGAAVLSAVLTSTVSSLTLASWLSWIFFILLAGWSFYMVSGSIFAAYIVTLPDMAPRDALRSARNLVRFRRWQILPKILYLPVFILIVMAIIIVPLIIFASFLVAPVFYVLSMLAILFVHSYLYSLYRGLLE